MRLLTSRVLPLPGDRTDRSFHLEAWVPPAPENTVANRKSGFELLGLRRRRGRNDRLDDTLPRVSRHDRIERFLRFVPVAFEKFASVRSSSLRMTRTVSWRLVASFPYVFATYSDSVTQSRQKKKKLQNDHHLVRIVTRGKKKMILYVTENRNIKRIAR